MDLVHLEDTLVQATLVLLMGPELPLGVVRTQFVGSCSRGCFVVVQRPRHVDSSSFACERVWRASRSWVQLFAGAGLQRSRSWMGASLQHLCLLAATDNDFRSGLDLERLFCVAKRLVLETGGRIVEVSILRVSKG